MKAIDTCTDLLTHMEWADATMWSCIHSCAAAADEEKLHGLLYHLHAGQRAFFLCWKGQPVEIPKHAEFTDFPALEKWARDGYGEIRAYMEKLDPKSLDRPIEIPWSKGFEERFEEKAAPLTLTDTMNQVCLHSSHHRAQVCSYLRALEAEPPTVDYILWGWLGKPTPSWLT
jgi:uncharacterized damage-inducible protein DinB